jgi:hypothetical protein
MKAFGLLLVGALLSWTSLIYARLRAARRAILWLPVKLAAANFAFDLGVKSAALLLPHADHAFDLLDTYWSPAARQALWHGERFLACIAALPQRVDSGPPSPAREHALAAAH